MKNIIFPKISSERNSDIRKKITKVNNNVFVFDPALLEECYQEAGAFPPTGGARITLPELSRFREKCVELSDQLPSVSDKKFSTKFDLYMGELLFMETSQSRSSMGEARVWDFITFILLPDIAISRFPEQTNKISERFVGGSRRHVFQRLWKRWQLLGTDIVSSEALLEDDYTQIIERRFLLERSDVAKAIAELIMSSTLSGDKRRQYTRVLLRVVTQTSGLVVLDGGDPDHLNSALQYAHETALKIIEQR